MSNLITDPITFLIEEIRNKDRVTPRESERLKSLPYSDFLVTSYWNQIRKEMVKEADHKCQLCNNNSILHVHHKTYENHGYEHEHLEDLIVLCEGCHRKFHDKEKV
jgi:5-methylcytosine-specific restriction endonuclease McrA